MTQPSPSAYTTCLELETIQLWVHLGATADERAEPQEVHIALKCYFQAPLEACTSDQLDDTICYDGLSTHLANHCEGKHFQLIEHLGHLLHQEAKKKLPNNSILWLKLSKCNVPAKYITGKASFICSDMSLISSRENV